MSANDLELGWRWATRRDPGAFQALVSRHAGMVYGTCRRVLGDATEAEDVAQECFEILARTPKWPEGSLGAWLHRVATNRSLNRLKSERRRLDREARYAREQAGQSEGDWDDIYRYVDEAIAALPDKYRTPLIACFLESQSHATIAENLDIPRRTVTHRIGKGVEFIRTSLRKQGIPVASASLAAMLGANLVEAAPASLTASLGRIALAGVQATEAASALPAGGLLSRWLLMGGTLAMWQKVSVAVIAVVLVLLAFLWRGGPEWTGATAMPNSAHATAQEHRAASPPVSRDQSVASAKTAVVAALAADEKPASPDATASVQGIVIDDAGYPVDAAAIRLEVADDALGLELRNVFRAATDANGEFALKDIHPDGHMNLFAHKNGYLQARLSDLDLQPGGARKDVRLVLKKARYTVSGWVVDAQRRPIPEAEVCLRHYCMKWPSRGEFFSASSKVASTFTDAKGWFIIGVPDNADCDFTVLKEGFGPAFFREIGTGTDDATFMLQAAGSIAGRVVRRDGTPVPNAKIRATGKAELGGNAEGDNPAKVCPAATVTNDNGYYLLDDLGSDYTYDVRLDPQSLVALSAPPREDVKVASGRITADVDFIVQSLGPIRVSGKVTDRASGKPAPSVRIHASVVKPDDDFAGDTNAYAVTDADGAYALKLEVSRPVDLGIKWRYSDGANVFPKNNCSGNLPAPVSGELDVDVKTFHDLAPGTGQTLDFSVEAPIVVPLLFVDPAGRPVPKIRVGIAQGQATWDSVTYSGEDGRAVHRGLPPNVKFRINAILSEPERMTVGESEPLSGGPGETLPEQTIVCRFRGGVEGVLMDAQGRPVANVEIGCSAVRDDGSVVNPSTATTGEDGTFVLLHGLPTDAYQVLAIGYERDGVVEVGLLQDIEISPDAVLDLGTVRCEPMMSVEEAVEAAQAMEAEKEEEE